MSSKRRQRAVEALNREVRGWQADQELFDSTVMDRAGLNRTDWRCLDILGTRGPMTAGQLSRAPCPATGAGARGVRRARGGGPRPPGPAPQGPPEKVRRGTPQPAPPRAPGF